MINKEELGLRIRQEREKQGLSREALCGDEAELTGKAITPYRDRKIPTQT